jgi:heme exporter protein C
MNWIYSKWWKWLCAILLIYVTLGNIFIPLGPGITKVSPSAMYTDSVYTFRIKAYHAHFKAPTAGKVQLWFKNRTKFYAPLSVNVVSNDVLETRFAINSLQQDSFTPGSLDVVVNDDVDGTFALREAITIVKAEAVDTTSLITAIIPTEPEVAHNKHQLVCFPYREILYETIRNTFFHVPMWFAMTMLVFTSFIFSILYLMGSDKARQYDIIAEQSVIVAMLYGVCGYLTGLLWSKYTWYIGVSWSDVIRKLLLEDIKMAAALVAMFFYFAYLILRSAISDKERQAKVGALYSIFAFVVFILCVFVLPRLTDSMHPGNGGNPAFSKYDLDSTLRMFFYPAVIGWILLGFWILSILIRLKLVQQKLEK